MSDNMMRERVTVTLDVEIQTREEKGFGDLAGSLTRMVNALRDAVVNPEREDVGLTDVRFESWGTTGYNVKMGESE